MTYLVPAAYATMVVAALLLPSAPDRARGALGLPVFLLGMSSLPYVPGFRGPSLTVWISGALLLLGPVLLASAVWRARSRLDRRHPAAWVLLAGVAAGVAAAWPTLHQGGAFAASVAAAALAVDCWLLWLVGEALRVGRGVRWLDRRLPRGTWAWSRGTILWIVAAILLHGAWIVWPLWVLSWQPIGVGLAVVGVAWAAATRRPALALAAIAFATSFTAPESTLGGWGGWMVLTAGALGPPSRPRLIALVSALGAYLAWPALFGQEVVFTVLLTAAVTALLAQLASPHALEEGPPR